MTARHLVLVALAVALPACAIAPRRIEVPPSGAIPPEQRIEVWQAGKVTLVRNLAVDGDSLRAVPMPDDVACDSCAVRFAVAAVDSLRYPRNDHLAQVLTAVPIAVLAGATFIWGMTGGD